MEEAPHINLSSTPQTVKRGPLSKEERERRIREKLCLYCRKPNHFAKECRQKKAANQGKRPNVTPKIQANETTTEETPEETPQISSICVTSPIPYELAMMRPKSVPQDF